MDRLREIVHKEPVLLAGGVIEVAVVAFDAFDGGLSWQGIVKAVLVAALSWAVRNRVYSPATGASLEYEAAMWEQRAMELEAERDHFDK